jgi:hypothetical protein
MSGASGAVAKYSTKLSYRQDVVTDCGPPKGSASTGPGTSRPIICPDKIDVVGIEGSIVGRIRVTASQMPWYSDDA